jgi:hypothetical protein
MIVLLLHLFRLLPVLGGSHRHLALETPPLGQRLAVYKGTLRRPNLHPSDRLGWVLPIPGADRVPSPHDRDRRILSFVGTAARSRKGLDGSKSCPLPCAGSCDVRSLGASATIAGS